MQVVADDSLIYDIDVRWPGSTHDSRIWNRSAVKNDVEAGGFFIAGDSAYGISPILMKPYPVAEAENDPS